MFDPRKIALDAMAKAVESVEKIQTEAAGAAATPLDMGYKYQPQYTGYHSHIRTHLPADGWSSTEYRDYINELWYKATGFRSTNSKKYDFSCIKKYILDDARYNYRLPNVTIIEMIGEFFLQDNLQLKEQIPYFAFKTWIRQYYNANHLIYKNWSSVDEELGVAPRLNLILEGGEAMRKSMAIYMQCQVHGNEIYVEKYDPRLLMQLGIPVMYQWLRKQTAHDKEECLGHILYGLDILLRSDQISASHVHGYTQRVETCVKNTIMFEPYPWIKVPDSIDIRTGLFEMCQNSGFNQRDWWRENELKGGSTVPGCLNKVKSKCKDLPKLVKNRDFGAFLQEV